MSHIPFESYVSHCCHLHHFLQVSDLFEADEHIDMALGSLESGLNRLQQSSEVMYAELNGRGGVIETVDAMDYSMSVVHEKQQLVNRKASRIVKSS